jgi:hypothetical protein
MLRAWWARRTQALWAAVEVTGDLNTENRSGEKSRRKRCKKPRGVGEAVTARRSS